MFFDDMAFATINKLSTGRKSVSYSVRVDSIVASFRIIKENFLFGTGIGNADQTFERVVRSFSNSKQITNTSTILLGFAKFGFLPGLLYLVCVVKTSKVIINGISSVGIVVAFITMTSGISFLDSIFFNVIVFYYIAAMQKEGNFGAKKRENFINKFR